MARQSRRRGTALAVASASALAVLLAACGDDGGPAAGPSSSEPRCAAAEAGTVAIVAEDLAWDVPCLQAPAGEPLTIVVDNRDAGVNHNLHVRDLPGGPRTDLEAGPVVQRLELPAGLAAGEHTFVCDIHPNMAGTLELVAPDPQRGG